MRPLRSHDGVGLETNLVEVHHFGIGIRARNEVPGTGSLMGFVSLMGLPVHEQTPWSYS